MKEIWTNILKKRGVELMDNEDSNLKEPFTPDPDDGALSKGGEVDYKHPFRLGLFYHKFFQGFMISLVINPLLTYPFFARYLNLPGNMYNAVAALLSFVWSMKIFWAMLSDSFSIFKRYRISYMTIGWSIAAIGFTISYFIPLPQPYFGVTADCKQNHSEIVNPEAPESALPYIFMLLFILLFFGMADVASDGLSVVYARREPEATRGKATTYCSVMETVGIAVISIIAATLLNGAQYGGEFCFSLSYNQFLLAYGIVAILGIVNAVYFTVEPQTTRNQNLKTTFMQFWDLMATESFLRVAYFVLLNSVFHGIRSSANVKINAIWIKLTPLVTGIVGLSCISIVIGSMILYERFFISLNWRHALTACFVITVPLGFFSECLAIFNVVRNQYVNFFDDIIISVPRAVSSFINLQLATEISEEGNEGIAFGMIMTLTGLANPIATMFSNLLSAPFDVANNHRYMRDSMADRWNVFYSVFIAFCCNCFTIFLIFTLLPKQKRHVKRIKRNTHRYTRIRSMLIYTLFFSVIISISLNLLSVLPTTKCLYIAGGSGCSTSKNVTAV